jgi:uncharacterized membrane protein YfcA
MSGFATFFENYGHWTILLIAVLAFVAGFIDAIVGGGGLIQVPALLIAFPAIPLPVLFGTNKIAALAGTLTATLKYARRIRFDVPVLLLIAACCFASSFVGARLVSHLDSHKLKPVILLILTGIAIYTLFHKNLGAAKSKDLTRGRQMLYGGMIGLLVGFYDGFFGPGTGSFFVLGFVVILGFEFVKASAYAKVVNCVTNLSALTVFISKGYFILPLAIVMTIFNMTGSYLGSHLALTKGNGFVRIMFLVIVGIMICKFGYDLCFG